MSTAATLQPTPIHSKPIAATTTTTRQTYTAPSRKSMSVTQTYYLAHKARAKLSREAAQPDHDLRLLVGHANLLDSLMIELAEAEREQERWFNQSVRGNTKPKAVAEKRAHIQWADRIVEEEAIDENEYDDSSDSDSDSDFDYEEEDVKMAITTTTPAVTVEQVDEEDDDEEEDYAQLELVRTPSHSNSPPELLLDHHDSDSSDDESMPPSPAEATLPLPDGKQQQQHAKEQQQVYAEEEEYYGRRNATGLVSAIMVY